jgi:hypothetical protein
MIIILVTFVAYSAKLQQHVPTIEHAVRLNMLCIWLISTACFIRDIMTSCVVYDDSMSYFTAACSHTDSMFKWINILSDMA